MACPSGISCMRERVGDAGVESCVMATLPRPRCQPASHHGQEEECDPRIKKALGVASGGQVKLGVWLARKDSNLQSPDPESGALPLGHSPASRAKSYQEMTRRHPASERVCVDR